MASWSGGGGVGGVAVVITVAVKWNLQQKVNKKSSITTAVSFTLD